MFPRSDKSSDVIRTLQRAMEQRNVIVHTNTSIKKLYIEDGVCRGVVLGGSNKESVEKADAVIVATGGFPTPQLVLQVTGTVLPGIADTVYKKRCHPLFRFL